jgi:hypothetical protein
MMLKAGFAEDGDQFSFVLYKYLYKNIHNIYTNYSTS